MSETSSKKSFDVVPLLARRFLFSKSSGGFLSFISWISVAGVTLGVLALVTVTSVINGFEGELSRAVTGMNGDVLLYSKGNPIAHGDDIEKKIHEILPNTKAVTQSFVTELMVGASKGVAGAVLEGMDTRTVGLVTEIPKRVSEGRLPEQGDEIAMGNHIAEKIGAKVGSKVRLIIPFVGEKSESRVFSVTVVGIIRMGMYRYDSKYVFAPLATVQKLLQEPERVTTFRMSLTKGSDPDEAARKLVENFGYPFKAKSWAQLDKNLFYAIQLEKAVIAIILTAILVIAAFNVVSTLMMMIYDKTQEISILKAMGFRPSQSLRLFRGIGLLIGLTGTGVGVLLGIGLNRLIEKTRLIHLPEDVYNIGFLPVVEKWWEIAVIVLVSLLISFLATLYPSIRVMRRSPLEGIRSE